MLHSFPYNDPIILGKLSSLLVRLIPLWLQMSATNGSLLITMSKSIEYAKPNQAFTSFIV